MRIQPKSLLAVVLGAVVLMGILLIRRQRVIPPVGPPGPAMRAQEERLMKQVASSEAKAGLLNVARELERDRARQGVYPPALDTVRTILPSDPFTGQPFDYRREGGGFILEEPVRVGQGERLWWKSRP